MKSSLICSSLLAGMLVLSAGGASAQTGPWSGFYVGTGAGYQTSDIDWRFVNQNALPSQSPSDAALTVFAGYQAQLGQFVVGAEAGYNTTLGNQYGSTPCTNPAFNCQVAVSGFWTAGGKLGFALSDQFLVYGTGGYAEGNLKTQTPNVATGIPVDTSSEQHGGWYAGIGVDFSVTKNLLLGIDYKHIEFDTELHNLPFATESRDVSATSDVVMARLTLSWVAARQRQSQH